MEYKFLSQNPWVFHSLYLKEHKVLHHWFFKLIPNIQKVYNEIHEVNLCHLHSKMVALALLQPQCFTSPVYKQKKSHAKLSSFHLLDVTFSSSPLKYWPCYEVRSCALDSWYYVKNGVREMHAIVIRNLGRLTSGKTSASVLKLDDAKQGFQRGKLQHFSNHPKTTCFKIKASLGKSRGT